MNENDTEYPEKQEKLQNLLTFINTKHVATLLGLVEVYSFL